MTNAETIAMANLLKLLSKVTHDEISNEDFCVLLNMYQEKLFGSNSDEKWAVEYSFHSDDQIHAGFYTAEFKNNESQFSPNQTNFKLMIKDLGNTEYDEAKMQQLKKFNWYDFYAEGQQVKICANDFASKIISNVLLSYSTVKAEKAIKLVDLANVEEATNTNETTNDKK